MTTEITKWVKTQIEDLITTYHDMKTRKQIEEYLYSLNEKEQLALEIAKDHLKSSFDIVRSNGYMEWQKKNS